MPRVTFTHPEIASVGLTKAEARRAGHRFRVGRFDLRSLGKSLVESEGVGRVKIIGDARSGAILGGHIVAPAAGEMIHEIVAAMVARATVREVADAIHAYPTYAEETSQYRCSMCGASFHSEQELQEHQKTHMGK